MATNIDTRGWCQPFVVNCSAAMTSAISFGPANAGFQAGVINGSANVVFNAAPGKLQGSKLTEANDGPS